MSFLSFSLEKVIDPKISWTRLLWPTIYDSWLTSYASDTALIAFTLI